MEIWKVIKDFEDYEISNYGRVKSNKAKMKNTNGGILKPGRTKANDKGLFYCKVILVGKTIKQTKQVHRLVAEAFIPNIKNKPQVNHIDNDGTNNVYTNLEWCTAKENVAHQIKQGRHSFQVSTKTREARMKKQKFKAQMRLNMLIGSTFGFVKILGNIYKPISKDIRADYLCNKCGKKYFNMPVRKITDDKTRIMCGSCGKKEGWKKKHLREGKDIVSPI